MSRWTFVLWSLWIAGWFPSFSQGTPAQSISGIIANNPKTGRPVQDLKELLPLLSHDLKSHFTFIYESRSPHGKYGEDATDPMHPRVLLFSSDGRLALAFTGAPDRPGYNTIEAIAFNDQKASFELSQFTLPADKHPENGRINPPQCLRCHGADPKPITDSYPLWPGFYGSVRDTFPKGSKELVWYRRFLKQHAKKGVYQYLDWPKGTSVPPYLDPKQYDQNMVEASFDELKFTPNTRLGMAWTELNRKRIQRKLETSARYSQYRIALLSGLLGCRSLPISTAYEEKAYAAIYYENEDRLKRLGYRPRGPAKSELDMMELGMYRNLSQIEYVAQVLNVDTSDWSLAFESGSTSFFDGILSSAYGERDFYLKEDFIQEMLRNLAHDDDAFRPFLKTYLAYPEKGRAFAERLDLGQALKACALIEQREKEKPVSLPEAIVTSDEAPSINPSAVTLLNRLDITDVPFERCTRCHEGEAALIVGRKIPFDAPRELAVVLKASSKSGRIMKEEILARVALEGAGQMPPRGDRLTAVEKKELGRYLAEVQAR